MNREILGLLVKNQDKWESMAKVMGCPEYLIGDVVQDMYIKISTMSNPSKILYGDDDVNHFYVYLTIRSVFVSCLGVEQRSMPIDSVDLSLLEANDPLDMEHELAFDRLWNMIEKDINDLGMYGSKLTKTYFKSDKSIRKMASESGISATSIFNSIKQYRAYVVELHHENWEDYCNGDYDKI